MEVKDFWQRAVSLYFTVWSYGSKLSKNKAKFGRSRTKLED